MKKNLITAVLMTLVTTVLFGILFPLLITGLAQVLFRQKANGDLLAAKGKTVGSRLIGQSLGTALMAVAFGRAPQHATSIALWGAAALTLAGACASGLRQAD